MTDHPTSTRTITEATPADTGTTADTETLAVTDTQVISRAIASRLTGATSDTAQALVYVNSAYIAFTELAGDGWLSDTDLIETGDGDDAINRLAQATADLRDVARILENRQLRQQHSQLVGSEAGTGQPSRPGTDGRQ